MADDKIENDDVAYQETVADTKRRKQYILNVIAGLTQNGYRLRISFTKKVLYSNNKTLYKRDYLRLLALLQIPSCPVVITGNSQRTCLDSVDKLKAQFWRAPVADDESKLLAIKDLLMVTTVLMTDEEYLKFSTSRDYNQFYQKVQNYDINALNDNVSTEDLRNDPFELRPVNFNEDISRSTVGDFIERALYVKDSDNDLEFNFGAVRDAYHLNVAEIELNDNNNDRDLTQTQFITSSQEMDADNNDDNLSLIHI